MVLLVVSSSVLQSHCPGVFDEDTLPTLAVYHNGECVANLVRAHVTLPEYFNAHDLEHLLSESPSLKHLALLSPEAAASDQHLISDGEGDEPNQELIVNQAWSRANEVD